MADPRYIVVSDLPEFTVNDTETGRDLFPTQSLNRSTYCKRVDESTARMIADALNLHQSVRRLVGEWRETASTSADLHAGLYLAANELSALIDGKDGGQMTKPSSVFGAMASSDYTKKHGLP